VELTPLLENANVSKPHSGDEVATGTVVTATILGMEENFHHVSREAADIVGMEVYPESAPLGQAILGLKKGEKTTFKHRLGRPVKVEIRDIKPYEG
ncbi:GreA/GreB family elongation factor, partial [Actinotignum schaalii]